MTQKKVSIIIPIYNVEPYIERCISSVISQSYKCIEMLLVDDCGTDNSLGLALKVLHRNSSDIEFKVLKHKNNRGLSAARNTGMEAASGEYLFFLDSDDEIVPDCIERMMAVVAMHPDIEMVQGTTVSIPDRNFYHLEIFNDLGYVESNDEVRRLFYKISKYLPCNAWNKLIKVSFLTQNNLLFKEGLIHEDQLWMFFVCKYLKYYYYLPENTYLHYATDNSIMTSTSYHGNNCHWSVILNVIYHNIDQPFAKQQISKYFVKYYCSRLGEKDFDISKFKYALLSALFRYFNPHIAIIYAISLFNFSKPSAFSSKKMVHYLTTYFCNI